MPDISMDRKINQKKQLSQRATAIRRASWVGILGNGFLAVLKITVGIIAGSAAVIADGIDMIENAQKVVSGLRSRWTEFLETNSDRRHRVSSIELAFKANQRKQFEKAKSRGAAAILTVRSNEDGSRDGCDVDFFVSDEFQASVMFQRKPFEAYNA